MNKFYFRFGAFIVTLAFSSLIVWIFNNNVTIGNHEIETLVMPAVALKEPKFTETYRGCKPGYVQGYVTDDGYELTEGSGRGYCENPDKPDGTVVQSDDQRIISYIAFKGTMYFQIYQLESGLCIHSPTIELGIALENHIKNEELKLHKLWKEAEMLAKKQKYTAKDKKVIVK